MTFALTECPSLSLWNDNHLNKLANTEPGNGQRPKSQLVNVITIDGPAAAGKSTVARLLSKHLGIRYLDTGAMYRAVTWKALHANIDMTNENALAELVHATDVELLPAAQGTRVLVDGRDVTTEIRDPNVTAHVFHLADNVRVREQMVELQRRFAVTGPVVTEGRDQGTDAFPEASVKFYLDASPEERARRRSKDLQEGGKSQSFESILASIRERDQRDCTRPVGALRKAPGAVYINTDSLSVNEVVEQMSVEIYSRLRPRNQESA